jgi:hypothetical protein
MKKILFINGQPVVTVDTTISSAKIDEGDYDEKPIAVADYIITIITENLQYDNAERSFRWHWETE